MRSCWARDFEEVVSAFRLKVRSHLKLGIYPQKLLTRSNALHAWSWLSPAGSTQGSYSDASTMLKQSDQIISLIYQEPPVYNFAISLYSSNQRSGRSDSQSSMKLDPVSGLVWLLLWSDRAERRPIPPLPRKHGWRTILLLPESRNRPYQ